MPTAEDVERPKCECHGEPMTRNGHNSPAGPQKWCCAIVRRERSRDDYWKRGRKENLAAVYRERVERGVCGRCEGPLLTESVCWDCLNAMEERHALGL